MTTSDRWPLEAFLELFERAKRQAREGDDATACALATANEAGRPSVRMVLLKEVDERGFVFYTNYESRKADELEDNPWAAICFFWAWIGKQVRVEGAVERVTPEESDAYFRSRARASRIGAWASRQSRPLENRAALVARVARYEARYAGREVPRPEHWGGYRLTPGRIEIWHNQLHRLHDRLAHEKTPEGWTRTRLYP